MEIPKYKTKQEVLNKALTANGHTFSEYDINNRLSKKNNKGKLGQIMEEGLFGYPVNSSAEADFNNIGVEFKVTGIKQLKKSVKYKNGNVTMSAKERLSLKEINYFDLANQNFEESYLWQKIQCMLLMFYLYSEDKYEGDMEIMDSILYTFSGEDYEIIKNDYNVIREKVLKGEAHLISESDTMYLGACRKGAGGENDKTSQPFSDIKAYKRGYCLKNSYLTEIIRSNFIDNITFNVIDANGLKQYSFENVIEKKLSQFYGKTKRELCTIFNVNERAKDANSKIIAKIFGVNKINNIEEFVKSGITLKTVELKPDGTVKEEMSFTPFVFEEIINESWFESETRQMFSNKFLFIVFQLNGKGDSIFKKVRFWNMPEQLLDSEIKLVFEKTQRVLKSGDVVLSLKEGNRIYKFPKAKDHPICFVKNHASTVKYVDKLPFKDINFGVEFITKQSFWLGKQFIKKIIDDDINKRMI